ncbi:hypothetical protein HPP92_000710 [Vanilla planifolia]|uniref:Uncharacterized protein n=1 Tax=Vanilla planifolia TaxID=51239 RepID=A0A835RUY7_VANPL|nr:hypothetical protein HPP92_000710 [Vanilla planifolia]
MSWFKSAVNKAVEVSGKHNLTRTVRNYADTVVHQAGQAVVGGARILQDRMGMKNYKSFKQTVRRLEEAAVSYRGQERVQLLKRWLLALKDIEKLSRASKDYKSPEEPHLLTDPKNVAAILEAPNEEEVCLLLEIFGLCFTGGQEVHNAIISSIQDLAKAFSSYQDEVLVKKEELLQFAQVAISGLKLNGEVARLDAEACRLGQTINSMESLQISSSESLSENSTHLTVEDLKGILAEIRICSRMETLLLKKRNIKLGDSPEIRSQKVEKLKILAESLANSSSKAEKRIFDNRHQKEEALSFRGAKATEVSEIEKELVAEIEVLEKQRDQLEAELKKVYISLNAANLRLNKTREERDQFDEASDQLVLHLKAKEDELSKSILSSKVEASVVRTWINFLEDTWILQSSYTELKEKETNTEMEKYGCIFSKLIRYRLSILKDELGRSIDRFRTFVHNLNKFNERLEATKDADHDILKETSPKKFLEEEYLEDEKKIVTALSVADRIKDLFYAEQGHPSREDDHDIRELFNAIGKIKVEFDSIERPALEIEAEKEKMAREEKPQSDVSHVVEPIPSPSSKLANEPQKSTKLVSKDSPRVKPISKHDQDSEDSELAKFEKEFGNVGDFSNEEIGGWEFDELEEELRSEANV